MLSTFCLRVKGLALKRKTTCPQGDFPTTILYTSLISEEITSKEGQISREDEVFWSCVLRYVIYMSSYHFLYKTFSKKIQMVKLLWY
jgi:hypothetical protein